MAPFMESYGKDQPYLPAGYVRPDQTIVTFKKPGAPEDEDVLAHELVHAGQKGIFGYRTQDPTVRRAISKLIRSTGREGERELNFPAKYVTMNPAGKNRSKIEFEAIVGTGVGSASNRGVDFSKSYDEILAQLKSDKNATQNMRLLAGLMDNDWSDKEKNLILKAIRANL